MLLSRAESNSNESTTDSCVHLLVLWSVVCVQEVRSLHGLASAVLSKVQPAAAGGDSSTQPAAERDGESTEE
jgi:hypothetical protein